MAFVAEDGTGLSSSNSFISLAAFKAYHDDRGQDYSALSDAQIQQRLILATDYMQARFDWVGQREAGSSQALDWPRADAFYMDGRAATGVPVEVQQACAEYALRASPTNADSLMPDPTYDTSGRDLVRERKQVGPIVKELEYSGMGQALTFRKYPIVDERLDELVVTGKHLLRA